MEAPVGIEPTYEGFAVPCLTDLATVPQEKSGTERVPQSPRAVNSWPPRAGLRIVNIPAAGLLLRAAPRGHNGSMTKPVIHVVEDQTELRESICEELARVGFHAVGASQGNRELTLLRKGAPPALILLDLLMPEKDGWEVVAAMKQDPKLKDVPVVLMSAIPPRSTTLQAQGVAAVLQKPFTMDELMFVVSRLVKMPAGPAARSK